MKLRHFLMGKFTAPVISRDKSDSKKYLDSEILALYPSESLELFRSLHSRLEHLIRALKPPRSAEHKDSDQADVLRLVIPRDTNEWLYIRIFPSAPLDHMNRDVMRYHAVLLSEQDLCALKWRPWRLDPHLFTGISADKVEGGLPRRQIGLGEKEVPIEFDVDFRLVGDKREPACFSEQVIERICSESEKGPIFITETSDPSALMNLLGEVAERRYSKERSASLLPMALGMRRVTAATEMISHYQLSLLPPNSDVTYSGLATIERGAGYFPISEWRESYLPASREGADQPAVAERRSNSLTTAYERPSAKPKEPVTRSETVLRKKDSVGKPETAPIGTQHPGRQIEKPNKGAIRQLEEELRNLSTRNKSLEKEISNLKSALRENQMGSPSNGQVKRAPQPRNAGTPKNTSRMKNYLALTVLLVLGCAAAMGLGAAWAKRSFSNKVANLESELTEIKNSDEYQTKESECEKKLQKTQLDWEKSLRETEQNWEIKLNATEQEHRNQKNTLTEELVKLRERVEKGLR